MQVEEFNEIVKELKDKMYRLSLRILKNPDDAKDAVQDAFIKIWRKREQLAEIDNKSAYCMTISRNVCIDKYRSKKMVVTNIDDQYDLVSDSADPERILSSKDAYNNVIKIINQLPENHRTVVHLRDIEGYTYKEISEITGNSIEKVKVYLHRARKKLKIEFEKKAIN